ncbi:hypothetical protein B0H12DRAFT_1079761 [Mycena haematopus]|nr:hypothetical protein B0H12DRAFT_1079761 [Mycena haematopus]
MAGDGRGIPPTIVGGARGMPPHGGVASGAVRTYEARPDVWFYLALSSDNAENRLGDCRYSKNDVGVKDYGSVLHQGLSVSNALITPKPVPVGAKRRECRVGRPCECVHQRTEPNRTKHRAELRHSNIWLMVQGCGGLTVAYPD